MAEACQETREAGWPGGGRARDSVGGGPGQGWRPGGGSPCEGPRTKASSPWQPALPGSASIPLGGFLPGDRSDDLCMRAVGGSGVRGEQLSELSLEPARCGCPPAPLHCSATPQAPPPTAEAQVQPRGLLGPSQDAPDQPPPLTQGTPGTPWSPVLLGFPPGSGHCAWLGQDLEEAQPERPLGHWVQSSFYRWEAEPREGEGFVHGHSAK